MTTETEIEEIRAQYGLQPGETLQDKWARELREERSRLRALTRDDIMRELEELGVDHAMLDEIEARMRG